MHLKCWSRYTCLAPDLGLIYGSPILKPELFEIPRCGTLGIHHGKVPAYRGNKTTFWAMYNGELNCRGHDSKGQSRVGYWQYRSRRRSADWSTLLSDLFGEIWKSSGLELYIQAITRSKKRYCNLPGTNRDRKASCIATPSSKDFLAFWVRQTQKAFRKRVVARIVIFCTGNEESVDETAQSLYLYRNLFPCGRRW
jgi:hypothetical protein